MDVAARAGVSTTTASYIVNGRSSQMRISPDTERRVREAVTSLGYRPNRNARSLRTATTSTIGVVTDFVASGMFASAMLAGANAAARRADHLLLIGETDGDADVRDRLLEEMHERQVDGVLYVTRTALAIDLPATLRDTRVVLLNCIDPSSRTASVLPDEVAGGTTAAGALLDAGVRSDVYVVGEESNPSAVAGPRRLRGVRQRLEMAGSSLGGVVSCEWSVESAREEVGAWLDAGLRPRGLVCMNDRIAMGVYQALAARGLGVPDDVSIVSFDGSELASWLKPRLTSVALPFKEMGALAVEMLLDPERGQDQRLLPMPLKDGLSIRTNAASPRV